MTAAMRRSTQVKTGAHGARAGNFRSLLDAVWTFRAE